MENKQLTWTVPRAISIVEDDVKEVIQYFNESDSPLTPDRKSREWATTMAMYYILNYTDFFLDEVPEEVKNAIIDYFSSTCAEMKQ